MFWISHSIRIILVTETSQFGQFKPHLQLKNGRTFNSVKLLCWYHYCSQQPSVQCIISTRDGAELRQKWFCQACVSDKQVMMTATTAVGSDVGWYCTVLSGTSCSSITSTANYTELNSLPFLTVDGVWIDQIEKFKHLKYSPLNEEFKTHLTFDLAPLKGWEIWL